MTGVHCSAYPLSFADEIGHRYRANCRRELDREAVSAWRPRGSSWRSLQALLMRALPALKPRETLVGNHRIFYWDIGAPDAEPVVLLHGFGASKENWLMLAPLLARSRRLLIPDIPGFGLSDFIARESYTVEAQVERLQAWLSQLNVGPVHLAGSSMGGLLAGALAAQHPEAVRSLTLMNSAGVLGERKSPFELALLEGRNYLVPINYTEVLRLFRLATHRNRQLLSWALAPFLYREMIGREPVNHRIFHDLLDSTLEPLEVMPKVRCPTLVFWGERDQVLDVSCTETLKRLMPHAQICILANVGHLPMLETPRLTAASLQRFWRRSA